jgi:hypothetical protein
VQGAAQPADAAVVRRRYGRGASVRLLHPQRHAAPVAAALALLEDALQCPVGSNVYLTPSGSQARIFTRDVALATLLHTARLGVS